MMQGTQNAIWQLKKEMTWQRFVRDFNYQQANRTKIFPSVTYFDPNARTHGLSWNQATVEKVHYGKEFIS